MNNAERRTGPDTRTYGWTPPPDFWEDHPEVVRGPVGWQLTRMYGPRCLEQLDRMQKLQQRLFISLVPSK